MRSLRTREFGNQQFLLLSCQVRGISTHFSQKDTLAGCLLAQIEPRSQQDCLCLIAQSLSVSTLINLVLNGLIKALPPPRETLIER